MRFLTALLALATTAFAEPASTPAAPAVDTKTYELRTYYAAPGKLPALESRFRDHTCALFEKHGITNVAYWTPLENKDNKLVYVVSFPDAAAREKSWKEFGADPDWKKAATESEKDGKLVLKVDSKILAATDFSPAIKPVGGDKAHIYELRTYITTPGNLPALHKRFREHTIGLFTKFGMSHLGYWQIPAGKPGADNTLIYVLCHDSMEACEKSFKEFRADPEWIAIKAASEKAAGGSLTIENGVISELLVPTDFSPSK